MRESNGFEETVPVRLNTSELRIMALRQQQQIDTQQQLLAAREQRLRFLKAQEACDTVAAAEGERLRRLRERVEAQESKLRRLRALRGQVDLQKTYNVTLGNDLNSIRALFSEKEKELTLAVAKVEALTRQLEDLRRDRRGTLNLFSGLPNQTQANSPAAIELEKLRRELTYRNQLSLQQDARLHMQREALQKRQAELQSVDQRILELQGRLNKKRISNLVQHKQNTPHTIHTSNICGNHIRSTSSTFYPQQRVPRNNIVAVEPFNHIPQKVTALGSNSSKFNILNNTSNANISSFTQTQSAHSLQNVSNEKNQNNRKVSHESFCSMTVNEHAMVAESDENKLAAKQKKQEYAAKNTDHDNDTYFIVSQSSHISDSIKMSNGFEQLNKMTYSDQEKPNDELILNSCYYNEDHILDNNRNTDMNIHDTIDNQLHSYTNECDSDKVFDLNGLSPRTQLTTTVHSTPLALLNKSVAVPVITPNKSGIDEQNHALKTRCTQSSRGFPYSPLQNIPSGNLVVPPRKPNGSATSMLTLKQKESSEIKVNMVTPQTQYIQPSTELVDKLKPALPPKPAKSNVLNTESECKIGTDNNVIEQTAISHYNQSKPIVGIILDNLPIKARPLTIKKSPHSEQPRLKHALNNINSYKVHVAAVNRADVQASNLYSESDKAPEAETAQSLMITDPEKSDDSNMSPDTKLPTTRSVVQHPNTDSNLDINLSKDRSDVSQDKRVDEISRRKRSFISSVISDGKSKFARRVSFDPLALLLDASLEGELELVQKTALQVPNPSAANDEGITALHNAICAGHVEIVKFLVNFGCDVNAQDSDGWTPLHCAASCNNLSMVKFLVESGACLFAATLSDHETPAEKCEEDEEGFDGCSEYLYSIQEKLGILNNGEVYAVFSYDAQQPDELSFSVNDKLTVIRKGDESEREWWWAKDSTASEGYVPRNLLGLCARVTPCSDNQND